MSVEHLPEGHPQCSQFHCMWNSLAPECCPGLCRTNLSRVDFTIVKVLFESALCQMHCGRYLMLESQHRRLNSEADATQHGRYSDADY